MSVSLAVCRGCLARGYDLQNMFELEIDQEFAAITNLQVVRYEGVSELLCLSCRRLLAGFRDFRGRCRASDESLRRQMAAELLITKQTDNVAFENNNKDQRSVVTLLEGDKMTLLITPKDLDSEKDNSFACPYNCVDAFTKRNHLTSHMVKNHGFDETKFNLETRYYCIHPTCQYALNSGADKHFSQRKTLRLHVLNVHSDKSLKCDVCGEKFSHNAALNRHKAVCETRYVCASCNIEYKTHERLMVHLMRKHPDLHKEYKRQRKSLKRAAKERDVNKKTKASNDGSKTETVVEEKTTDGERMFDPKLCLNDVPLNVCCHSPQTLKHTQTDNLNIFTSNETQTVFEDLLSMRTQSDDELETVSLSDIQTQTWPDKKVTTCQTQTNPFMNEGSPDLSFKETQTCFCYLDSPKPTPSHFNFPKYIFDSSNSSPNANLTSTETQTADVRARDVLLSFNSIETQTSEDYLLDGSKLNI